MAMLGLLMGRSLETSTMDVKRIGQSIALCDLGDNVVVRVMAGNHIIDCRPLRDTPKVTVVDIDVSLYLS